MMKNSKHSKILVVDDNPRVRSFIKSALEEEGYTYIESEDGWTAINMVEEESPDLVILDIMLEDERMGGLDVCKKIRAKGFRMPIIFLTVKDRAEEPFFMRRAFQLGGDDYISKREELRRIEQRMGIAPSELLERKSDIDELLARINARLQKVDSAKEFGDNLRVDLTSRLVERKNRDRWEEVHLTQTEFSLLEILFRKPGSPVGKIELMSQAGIDGEGSLQNHIMRLRRKLESDPATPEYILTYHGIGYRFGKKERN
ncbi:MAG: response regulator transcription factor [Dehalococcoidales bacterium]|nr:MAG: response regulator transcription factor [Dehalococcoidales bacterium]